MHVSSIVCYGKVKNDPFHLRQLLFSPCHSFSSFFICKYLHMSVWENYPSVSRDGETIHLTNTGGEWSWSVETPVKKLGPNSINHHHAYKWRPLIMHHADNPKLSPQLHSLVRYGGHYLTQSLWDCYCGKITSISPMQAWHIQSWSGWESKRNTFD